MGAPASLLNSSYFNFVAQFVAKLFSMYTPFTFASVKLQPCINLQAYNYIISKYSIESCVLINKKNEVVKYL
jgi:hypothetical protein